MKLEWDPANSTQEEVDDFLDSKFGMALQSFGLIGKAEDINKPEKSAYEQFIYDCMNAD